MNSTEFQAVLQKAVKGDRVALEQLLILYKPLIDHASMVTGSWMKTYVRRSCSIW